MNNKQQHEHIRPKKYLGQHFLINSAVARRIVEAVRLHSDDTVLEIGAGTGAITGYLLPRARRVVAVEMDTVLCKHLSRRFGSYSSFVLVNQDILKVHWDTLIGWAEGRPLVVVGNLPYQITSPVLFALIEHRAGISRSVLMVQREVAQRLEASPGTRAYGILSIMVQRHSRVRIHFKVGSSCFYPVPRVESSVVELDFTTSVSPVPQDEALFKAMVRAAFQQRRKMLKNALSSWIERIGLPPDVLEKAAGNASIDLQRRPETLSIEDFVRLGDAIQTLGFPHKMISSCPVTSV